LGKPGDPRECESNMNEAIFRIFAGDRHVDIQTTSEGFPLERLFELEEGDRLEDSVFLRAPRSAVPSEIRSFLTAMKDIRVVAEGTPDARIEVALGREPALEVEGQRFSLTLSGELIARPKDRRRTLAGNLGLFYSLSLFLLEKRHGIVSYHSSTLVDEKNRIVYINGGDASSGKSVIMLEYMAHYGAGCDYRVLSTEMGHLSILNGEMAVYRGAGFDNVSLFPGEPQKAELMSRLFPHDEMPDPDGQVEVRGTDGSVKAAVSVKEFYARSDSYRSRDGYRLVYLMPTIHPSYKTVDPDILPRGGYDGMLSSLIGVARQKLGQKQPSWIYDERAALFLPAWYLGAEQTMEARTIEQSLGERHLLAVVRIKGNPKDFNAKPGAYWSKIARLLELD
jgi:hypothetical protein